MEFGLFSASGYRNNAIAAHTYDEDIDEIVLADELGFSEAWIAENSISTNRVRPDIVTAANLLICKAAAMTKRIRLGTGVRPLPFYQPIEVVIEANTCDHLTGGRFMFGWGGTRAAGRDANLQRGMPTDVDTREMVYESIDFIMKCWTTSEPFDFEGKYYHGKGICVQPRPLQQPHPPIAAACSGTPETLELAGRYGFIPLLGRGSDTPEAIQQMGDIYRRAAEEAGRTPRRGDFRVTHFVYVADSLAEAKDDVREAMTRVLEGQKRRDPAFITSCVPPGGSVEDVTIDYLIDAGFYFVGDPDTVYRRIKDFYDACGGFGLLILAVGHPHATREKRERSMRMFAEEVAPRLAVLDPDRETTHAATR